VCCLLCFVCIQYERHLERDRANEATKTIDAEWKELQLLMSAIEVCTDIVWSFIFHLLQGFNRKLIKMVLQVILYMVVLLLMFICLKKGKA